MRWPPDFSMQSVTRYYRTLLRACARSSNLHIGEKLHSTAITTGLLSSPDSYIRNAILHMYSAVGRSWSAHKVFEEIPYSHKDTVDWTTLMGCYTATGRVLDALFLFVDMQEHHVFPDDITFVCIFNSCARLCDNGVGVQAHGYLIKIGFGSSIKACNALMDAYVKCGLVNEARKVFDDMEEHTVVSWTVLLEGVVKWVGLESGRIIFDEMPRRNEIAWTLIIAAYVEHGYTREAFRLLGKMLSDSKLHLNHVTICSLLSACTLSGDLIMGSWLHAYTVKTIETEMNIMVGTSFIDMYAKCGKIDTAFHVFNTLPNKNVVAWNAMLTGLAMHGRGRTVLDIFPCMIKEAITPDEVTFIALLSSCSHSGYLRQGRQYFYSLESSYKITPSMEHYACMVDLLGRAGELEEAETLIRSMPMIPNEVVLGSLLGSCSTHKKIELGERLMQELIKIHPLNTEYHVLLSNMYALEGKQEKANCLRKTLKERGIGKVPGMSWIHVGGQVHRFSAGDKSHPQTRKLYLALDDMIRRLRLAGYVPNTASQVFLRGGKNNYDEVEEKEQALLYHSEKLAICFGLMSSRDGAPIYIFKNLRICQDCHSAMKIVSAVYKRDIVIRDRSRFHCFKDGSCSCSDYW